MALACALLLLASCATAPRVQRTDADYLSLLPDGQTVYVTLDLEAARDLLPAVAAELGLETAGLVPALGRSHELYAAALLAPGAKPLFSAVIRGEYPPSGVRASLCLKRDWIRHASAGRVWHESRRTGLQVAAVEPGAVLVSNGRIGDLLAAAEAPRLPASAAELVPLAEGAGLLIFFPEVPAALDGSAGGKALPVERLWLIATRGDGGEGETAPLDVPLGIELGFRLSGEPEARLFRPVLRLLLLGLARQGRLPGGAAALSGLRDQIDGNVLRLTGLHLTVGQAISAARQLLGGAGGPGGLGGPGDG